MTGKLGQVVPADGESSIKGLPPPEPGNWGDRQKTSKPRGFRFACCVTERHYPGAYPVQPPLARGSLIEAMSQKAVVGIGSGAADVPSGIFDAHAHLLDFAQHGEGIGALLQAMDRCGVSHAALMGCPLKKNWSEFEDRMSPDAHNDTDRLYHYSLTDMLMMDDLRALPRGTAARFRPLTCGFKPTDKGAAEQIGRLLDRHQEYRWGGIGKIYTRSSELTTLMPGPTASPNHPAFDLIMTEAHNHNLPVLIQHNAASCSAKPYKYGFEFVPELRECLQKHPRVDILWVGGGAFERGQWAGYSEMLGGLLEGHPNLHVSVTGKTLRQTQINRKEVLDLVEKYPYRFMVGSSVMGSFTKKGEYEEEWVLLKQFLGGLSTLTYQKVRFDNANRFFGSRRSRTWQPQGEAQQTEWLRKGRAQQHVDLHDPEEARRKDLLPPAEKHRSFEGMVDGVLKHDAEIRNVCIDTHLHMLDFLQKSSGTRKILQAMDGCGVERAVLIGMPCCKKWSKDEPERPLYYQDDYGDCYFYAYSDQMVADAWMALPDEKRWRFAPIMGAFNPTDLHAIDHVQRMWDKYPGLWRGIGEVMCRHDDLTMLLQEEETPVINHIGMRALYEFCVEHDINALVHHNATRTAVKHGGSEYQYLWEVKQVLEEFPTLRLIWCHAGVSRRTHEDNHHEMLDQMLSSYGNLNVDISWVVWEDVICGAGSTQPKKGWINLFQKHPTRFTIGSDQVGQFIGPNGGNLLKPEIVKYWAIAEVMPADVAKAIMYDNAKRIWFDGWTPPSAKEPRFWQIEPCMRAETLHHNEGKFIWDNEEIIEPTSTASQSARALDAASAAARPFSNQLLRARGAPPPCKAMFRGTSSKPSSCRRASAEHFDWGRLKPPVQGNSTALSSPPLSRTLFLEAYAL
eukprot:CAMPEP_0179091178 /NCGR_PEP_ID=MMETSP0796-20121207/41638_1 /TAXON_ID=73915 /ORGANISM="Pyrodinium bahamense, Strain pbaha01" /LENGTH=904 /DNA_ID=CAMNT_0020788765 /DNA_START=9 /DNA_END=2723 /DNA_ORIENTATION=+